MAADIGSSGRSVPAEMLAGGARSCLVRTSPSVEVACAVVDMTVHEVGVQIGQVGGCQPLDCNSKRAVDRSQAVGVMRIGFPLRRLYMLFVSVPICHPDKCNDIQVWLWKLVGTRSC